MNDVMRDWGGRWWGWGWRGIGLGVMGLFWAGWVWGQAPLGQDVSYRHEVQHAIRRGLAALEARQNADGWWTTPEHPAITALALLAWQGDPGAEAGRVKPGWVQRGYEHVRGSIQADGSIHRGSLVTYNTSICLMALLASREAGDHPAILRARAYLVGLQRDLGEAGKIDTPFDGGVGYGSKYEHSDMGNTVQALEAIYYARAVREAEERSGGSDLNWEAVRHFLQSCQNLPSHNRQAWVSGDEANRGGFVYYPGHSMAGAVTNEETGRVALRSYGSVSYAGLLSYIYADLRRDDPRVKAVFDWLRGNYTLEENPGMGQQGLYYYFHTMSKALAVLGVRELELAEGRRVDWRRELSRRLLNLQATDGSWSNPENRWWEKDPNLVTAYAVLTLEHLFGGL